MAKRTCHRGYIHCLNTVYSLEVEALSAEQVSTKAKLYWGYVSKWCKIKRLVAFVVVCVS